MEEVMEVEEPSNFYRFIGIDLSLTGTGLTILDEDANIITQKCIATSSSQDIVTRCRLIEREIKSYLHEYALYEGKAVYIEGLSFGSKGNAALELAGLHYIMRYSLEYYLTVDKVEVIPPTVIKKYVTGKGNAKKNIMLKEAYKKWGIDMNDDNVCDSYALARMSHEDNHGKKVRSS